MAINITDTLWTRTGKPVKVVHINPDNNKLILDDNFDNVQKNSKFGIRNGINQEERDSFYSILDEVKSSDKIQEINDLFNKIKTLKSQNADPRLIKYLDSELQFLIIREKYTPERYETEPLNLGA